MQSSHYFTRSRTVLLALGLAALAGCKREGGGMGMQMPARPPAKVSVVSAVTRNVPLYLDAIGKTVAVESVSVIPQIGGKVIEAPVENGAMVNKGDLLFAIDPRPSEAALASAQATYNQAKVDHDFAVQEYDRLNNLTNKAAMSQQEFDTRKNAIAVAAAKMASAEAAIETAKLNLEYCRIYSPITGRAGVRMVDVGNVVKENGSPMLQIQRLDPIYAEFTITENDLGTVRKFLAERGVSLAAARQNLKVEVDVPGNSARVLSALSALPAPTQPVTNTAGVRTGKLVFLDNSVQGSTGTIKLRAELPNEDQYFWPGQFVNCRLILANKPDAVLVPAAAQQLGQQGSYVYVVAEDGTAKLRPIVAGQRQGDMLVIEKGVAPGEKVITVGQLTVVPESKVQVISADGKAPTTAPAVERATASAQ